MYIFSAYAENPAQNKPFEQNVPSMLLKLEFCEKPSFITKTYQIINILESIC